MVDLEKYADTLRQLSILLRSGRIIDKVGIRTGSKQGEYCLANSPLELKFVKWCKDGRVVHGLGKDVDHDLDIVAIEPYSDADVLSPVVDQIVSSEEFKRHVSQYLKSAVGDLVTRAVLKRLGIKQ